MKKVNTSSNFTAASHGALTKKSVFTEPAKLIFSKNCGKPAPSFEAGRGTSRR